MAQLALNVILAYALYSGQPKRWRQRHMRGEVVGSSATSELPIVTPDADTYPEDYGQNMYLCAQCEAASQHLYIHMYIYMCICIYINTYVRPYVYVRMHVWTQLALEC